MFKNIRVVHKTRKLLSSAQQYSKVIKLYPCNHTNNISKYSCCAVFPRAKNKMPGTTIFQRLLEDSWQQKSVRFLQVWSK